MKKKCLYFIDDVIWVFRDLARKKPASLFANPFLSVLKEAHDKYGLKTQLNVFYCTDNYYGNDDFSLSEMPDTYKEEFKANSDWLKLAFHARQEFPDYPYVNASYEQVTEDFNRIKNEIFRFAGEDSFTRAIVPHWLPVSYEGCRALYDCGIRTISATHGVKKEFEGNAEALPYGHAQRLLHNRKPETALFTRDTNNAAIQSSICGYNHVEDVEAYERILKTTKGIRDEKTGLIFKRACNGICLNLYTSEALTKALSEKIEDNWEYIGIGNHEQYFYEDYFAYQPEYAEKTLYTARKLKEAGYECIFIEELTQ